MVADLSNVTRLIKEKRSLSALYQVYFKSIVFRQDSYSKSILNSLQDQLLPEGAICKNLRRTNRRIMGPKALSIFNLKMETSNKILVLWRYRLKTTCLFVCLFVYGFLPVFISVQFSSVAQSCPTLCDPMDCNTPGLPVHHQLPESTQTHVH